MYKQCSAQERPLYTTPFRLTIRLTFSSWIESHIRWTVPASDAGVEARAGPGSTSTDGILFYVFANLARHLSVGPSPAAAGVSLSYGSALPGRSGCLRKTPVRPSAAGCPRNYWTKCIRPVVCSLDYQTLTASIQATTSPVAGTAASVAYSSPSRKSRSSCNNWQATWWTQKLSASTLNYVFWKSPNSSSACGVSAPYSSCTVQKTLVLGDRKTAFASSEKSIITVTGQANRSAS